MKYDPTGILIWDKSLPGQTNFTHNLVCDSQNSIVLAHNQMPPPDSALAEVGSTGTLWLSKLDEDGEIIWKQEIAEVGSAHLALDQKDNVVLLTTAYVYNRSPVESRFHSIDSYEIWMSLFATDGEKQSKPVKKKPTNAVGT